MNIGLLNRIGEWNPQLFRELKGRLKGRNVAIASALSLLAQLLLFMSFNAQLPVAPLPGEYTSTMYSRYCTGSYPYADSYKYQSDYPCLRDATGNFLIHWQHWWLDIFLWLSLIGMFILLGAGTYMLISDRDREDRRGTLNFIRLSPQSTQTILIGKLLGVPILLYLAGVIAIPFHVLAGMNAGFSLGLIVSFYIVLTASCICFFNAAMLFGSVTTWLGGFQPWLGSGSLLFFLWLSTMKPIVQQAADWINVLSPSIVLSGIISATVSENRVYWLVEHLDKLQWFYLPIGDRLLDVVLLSLASYAFWTYWIWQSLKRLFPNPGVTILSKKQSYLLVAGTEIFILGFSLPSTSISNSFGGLLGLNLLLFLVIIAALTPQRQALYDWARYRRDNVPTTKGFWHSSLIRDLIWGEKSPALVAIAINLVSSTVVLIPWMLKWQQALSSLILGLNCILIYGAIAQLFLLMKTQKNNVVWAVSAIGIVVFLPPITLGLLSVHPEKQPLLWLFSAFPVFWSWQAIDQISTMKILLVILGQWLVFSALSVQLTRQLRRAGESASKALIAGRSAG